MINVPVSVGELLDKISILQIKSKRICDPDKLANVRRELDALTQAANGVRMPDHESQLYGVNCLLWDIEDRIREKEKLGKFDAEFVGLARAVYITNDKRAEIKRQINVVAGSELVEEKSYV